MSSSSLEPRFRLRLRRGRDRSVELRHPWLFSGAVEEIEALPDAVPGDVGDVLSADGRFLARGTVHPESQIVCRLLTWTDESIDEAFFDARIARAIELRRDLLSSTRTNACRLVNAEGDELPGFVVDRYHQYLVVQTLSAGMARAQNLWLAVLVDRMKPLGILERGDHSAREEVGTEPGQVLHGLVPNDPLLIHENGLSFRVDLFGGQKTGFYLDQRESRALLGGDCEDARVLNLFGYTGGFSVYAGDGGATEVVQVETSAPARELAAENWALNGLTARSLQLVDQDAFRYVRETTETFDRIVLDPPPLARSRSSLDNALRAYKDLHLWALCRTRPGAEIFTFSCSQQVSPDLFQKVVFGAAHDVGASVQWIARLGAGRDHPVHLNHPQGEYLKGLHLRVLQPGTAPERKPGSRAKGTEREGVPAERSSRPERGSLKLPDLEEDS